MSTPPSVSPRPDAGHARHLTSWLVVLLPVTLFVLLRARWIGHLLSWDEAMNLLTVRALAGGGTDYYSYWFWRHPPLFNVLGLLLAPLQAGFAEREQWLALGVGAAGLIPFYILNRRAYGAKVALASLGFLAVMPGSIFFGTWIKEEPLVIFFGLAAFLWFDRRRHWLAGLALGLACLSKEFGMFYGVAVAGLWWLRTPPERRWQDLAATATACLLTACWWYLLFSVSLQHFWRFSIGHGGSENTYWTGPWYYYFDKLPNDLGWLGVAWLAAGGLAVAWRVWRSRHRKPDGPAPGGDLLAAWPLAFLLPTLVVLTLARGKTPWFSMTLYPALATLQAVGLVAVLRGLPRLLPGLPRQTRQWLAGLIVAILAGLLLYPRLGDTYEALARRQEEVLLKGSLLSARAAAAMNVLAHEGERVLITPMNYWSVDAPIPCPIFVYYFHPAPVVVRLNSLSPQELVDTVRRYRLDWVMLSPPPKTGEKDLLQPLRQQYGLRPAYALRTYIFRTTALWETNAPAAAPDAAHPLAPRPR